MDPDVTLHLLDHANAARLDGATVFDGPVMADSLAQFVEDPGHILLFATVGDTVAGFASGVVMYHPDKAPMLFVSEVGVDEPFRRRGIAKALTGALLHHARTLGCEGIWVATEADNAPAQKLYETLAARRTDGIVVYDWDGAMDAPQAG